METRFERRDSPRIPALLYVRGLGEEREFTEKIGDLGLGGVGFPTETPADRFEVRFSLPGDPVLREALGEVVNRRQAFGLSEPFVVGLRFVSLRDEDERALARRLDELARQGISIFQGAYALPLTEPEIEGAIEQMSLGGYAPLVGAGSEVTIPIGQPHSR